MTVLAARARRDGAMSCRVQITWRRKGARKPADVVVVARPARWGNPFDWRGIGKPEAVRRFSEALLAGRLPYTVADVRRELRGKRLACYCKTGEPCHADVLLEVAAEGAD